MTTWMELENTVLSEVKSDKEKQILYYFTHKEYNKQTKSKINEQTKPNKNQAHRYREQNSDYQRGKGLGAGVRWRRSRKYVREELYGDRWNEN